MVLLTTAIGMGTIAYFSLNRPKLDLALTSFVQKKAFYTAEGTRYLAIQIAQNYFSQNRNFTTDGLSKAIELGLTPALPSGYTVTVQFCSIDAAPAPGPIPNGPFMGMVAPQSRVHFIYDVVAPGGNELTRQRSSLDVTLNLAQIGLFQFAYFFDVDYADFTPGPPTIVNGWIHSNGDFCASSDSTLQIQKVTVAGRINVSSRPECKYQIWQSAFPQFAVVSHPDPSNPADWLPLTYWGGNSCTDCDYNPGTSWPTYSISRWNRQVLDQGSSGSNVSKLKLPLSDSIQVQAGVNGDDPGTVYSNRGNIRFLLDPVRKNDPKLIQQMKFANQADIRIIDGIWYVKDLGNDTNWPGIPVWSDHPGHFTDQFGHSVGQADLRSALHWLSTPKRFSYYPYDEKTKNLSVTPVFKGDGTPDASAVISYGTLSKIKDDQWYPGQYLQRGNLDFNWDWPYIAYDYWVYGKEHYVHRECHGDRICSFNEEARVVGINNSGTGCPDDTKGENPIVPASSTVQCKKYIAATETFPPPESAWGYTGTIAQDSAQFAAEYTLPPGTAFLNSARGTIYDNHIAWGWSQYEADLLPTNFDISQFQAALKDTSAGELGSYFAQGGLVGRPFNGVLWITSTYPGSDDGYSPEGVSQDWPTPFNSPDANQIMTTSLSWGYPVNDVNQFFLPTVIHSLPYNLCSDSLNGQPFDFTQNDDGDPTATPPRAPNYDNRHTAVQWNIWLNGALTGGTIYNVDNPPTDRRFVIPSCADYQNKKMWSFSNLIRLFHGKTLDPNLFPTGLSIVSNMPIYLMGSYNNSSDPNSSVTAGPSTWIPAMVAGDQVTFLSKSFDDSQANITNLWTAHRIASSTTYNLSYITGWSRKAWSAPIHSNPALYEDWTGQQMTFNGSIAVGFYPVYEKSSRFWCQGCSGRTYAAGNRYIGYDQHLSLGVNQPPGSPLFFVSSVVNWKAY